MLCDRRLFENIKISPDRFYDKTLKMYTNGFTINWSPKLVGMLFNRKTISHLTSYIFILLVVY